MIKAQTRTEPPDAQNAAFALCLHAGLHRRGVCDPNG